jgi:hypothetical protein
MNTKNQKMYIEKISRIIGRSQVLMGLAIIVALMIPAAALAASGHGRVAGRVVVSPRVSGISAGVLENDKLFNLLCSHTKKGLVACGATWTHFVSGTPANFEEKLTRACFNNYCVGKASASSFKSAGSSYAKTRGLYYDSSSVKFSKVAAPETFLLEDSGIKSFACAQTVKFYAGKSLLLEYKNNGYASALGDHPFAKGCGAVTSNGKEAF